jgi:CRP/FNR family cyclic AMP-dependent transcriptional regulator
MAANQIVRALARLPVFEGLTLVQLDELARRAEHVLYHPGAVIMEESTEGHAAILLISGEAARVSGPELKSRVEPIPPGSLLGETAMLIEATYGSTVVARGHVRALRITRDELRAQMASDPTVADKLVHNIAQRLLRLADELRKVDAILAGTEAETPTVTARPPLTELPAPAH